MEEVVVGQEAGGVALAVGMAVDTAAAATALPRSHREEDIEAATEVAPEATTPTERHSCMMEQLH